MTSSSVVISPESGRANNCPATGFTKTAHSGSQDEVNSADDFKTLIDRRLDPKRPLHTSKRNTETVATSKSGGEDGKPMPAALTSQTNADLGVQGTTGEWRPSEIFDQPNSGDVDQTVNAMSYSSPQSMGGDGPCLDPSGQTRVLAGATDQDKLAAIAPDDGEADGASSAVGQKLPTSDVPQQAISAFGRTSFPPPASPSSAETAGIQASTTSDNSQNALGTSVAKVSDP